METRTTDRCRVNDGPTISFNTLHGMGRFYSAQRLLAPALRSF